MLASNVVGSNQRL